jgi:hypothetical protein
MWHGQGQSGINLRSISKKATAPDGRCKMLIVSALKGCDFCCGNTFPAKFFHLVGDGLTQPLGLRRAQPPG